METPFTPISALGEFGLIDRLESVLGEPADKSLIAGIGDDAAVYRTGGDRVSIVTSDALIEGVHFDLSFMPLEHLGAKSMTVNISDVVAMNAIPRYATIMLGVPDHVSVEMIDAFYRGVKKVCDAYDVTVIGGDITGARQFTVGVTAIGEAVEESVVYRKGAQPGDVLCVSGDLGSAFAGLKVLLRQRVQLQNEGAEFVPNINEYRYVINRNLAPVARLGIVQSWQTAGFKPSAMIDISDGLSSELHHLCRRSGCGAVLRISTVPIHEQTRKVAGEFGEQPETYALQGGEDYELLFAASPNDLTKLKDSSYAVIGEFTVAEEGLQVVNVDGDTSNLDSSGFDHFSGDL